MGRIDYSGLITYVSDSEIHSADSRCGGFAGRNGLISNDSSQNYDFSAGEYVLHAIWLSDSPGVQDMNECGA